MKPINVTNEKIAALRKKESAVKSALAAALVDAQRARAKLQAHEFSTVGEALCKFAAKSPEFHATLEAMLGAAVATIDEPSKRFLASRGWRL